MMRVDKNPCKYRSIIKIHAPPLKHRIRGFLLRWMLIHLSKICDPCWGGEINPSRIKISKKITGRSRLNETPPSQIRNNDRIR